MPNETILSKNILRLFEILDFYMNNYLFLGYLLMVYLKNINNAVISLYYSSQTTHMKKITNE